MQMIGSVHICISYWVG